MARGQRKSIEEKIAEKQELINSLNSRLEKETEELNSLLSEQKYQEIENLYELVKASNLSIEDVTAILNGYLTDNTDNYEETA